FIKIQFTKNGRIAGATIEKYLLEKTRLTHQTPGERNYHIFYQLLRGASPALLEELHLSACVESYAYLQPSAASSSIPNVSDKEQFAVTCECMHSVGMDTALQGDIFRLLSSILHLGDVRFDRDETDDLVSGASAATYEHLRVAAELLGVGAEELLACMAQQNMYVGGSTIVKVQSLSQAVDKRNSFAKTVYSMLFSWLIEKVNSTIAPTQVELRGYIGLLDIYGFENFDALNSFEQLCINYANEKLQLHFNSHIFRIEQAEYESESIDWSYIEFRDNQACVELVDGKVNGKSGIFQTLDDSSNSGRADINTNFLTTLNQAWSGSSSSPAHAHYVAPRFNSDQRFGVLHYAGEVFYEISGFAEKNRDCTNQDMRDLMASSRNPLLVVITEEAMRAESCASAASAATAFSTAPHPARKNSGTAKSSTGKGSFVSKLKEDSISKQFTTSLRLLFANLESTEPHFVRCVKPNVYKRADCMNAEEMLLQLKNAGMMETIRIRQQGYALRILHKDCFFKYHRLVPQCKTLVAMVDELSRSLSVSSESWQVGTTRIFIRRDMSEKLDRLLWLRYSTSSGVIQRFWRNVLRKRAVVVLQAAVRRHLACALLRHSLRAVLRLQTAARTRACLVRYRWTMAAVATIQRIALGKAARMLARKLRNPYSRMGYTDIIYCLRQAQADIREALAAQDFGRCAELEAAVEDMGAAKLKLPLPEVHPVSRAQIELHVVEAGFAMIDAEERGDSGMIGLLEEHMEGLHCLRAQFPTPEELSAELQETRRQLAQAMANKEFKQCGVLQAQASRLEARLQEGAGAVAPVAQLRQQRSELEADIAQALAGQQFDRCGSLQTELDTVVEVLGRRDITPEEAQIRRMEVEADMRSARACGDFLRMAELLSMLDELKSILNPPETPTESAEVECVQVRSRIELEARIAQAEEEKAAAAVAKKYAVCQQLEDELEQLQSALASLPAHHTRTQLRALIATKEGEIAAALGAKQYARCDALDAELVALQAHLQELPSASKLSLEIGSLEVQLREHIAAKQYGKCASVEERLGELRFVYEKLVLEEPGSPSPPSRSAPSSPVPDTLKPSVRRPLTVKAASAVKKVLVKAAPPTVQSKVENKENEYERPVSKLRPKAPVTALDSESILDVAKKMAGSRADAALLLGADGSLSGILTDNDVTRRVVSQFINPSEAAVSSVMTRNPKCVHASESALDALEMMVDNRFRHLPVLDGEGVVVGLLDIAKCLYDAISVLEKVQGDEGGGSGSASASGSGSGSGAGASGADAGAAMAQAMTAAMKAAAGGRSANTAQLAAMQALMEHMFGGSVPTLRSIIAQSPGSAGGKVCSVLPTASVAEASQLMAETRKGVLVMQAQTLLGILTPKDVLNRVIAKGSDPSSTLVSEVMTANPDCVSGDLTVLDALREMHDQKYLHLPVREAGGGRVLGIVDVMELICGTAS
ncbi:P-loop containing nucleoside triphosphate hydrolase protein, partial [Ochromonadaceae sp. CCMP2298]